ncbi:MAG: F0F1 ATP synthase subunit gamma [Sulfurimonas sp. RIFCSPHIGHO2_12_FULL_36_9]|uniref:ATP synthase F1 subunit gamma n=1 Tax=Sulfurimonas sp. RIFCSPLOWO2_12_36_12 TaxID=1802253 RepID=UPI0008ABC894|nr:ATP synthase F1 subunit gamma [Sulfurimonas sp. RIFCSPLOWO2_12_36_12]OHD97672.1 MAG: F0F1 ATP synthase subunit gamma [Sulfurimonas sp. RIFCSPHIGHO2_12_FULL_36_9]OHD98097.1 MAG: F0F1 ATP synthase subunit gamma [Sulfurimonas sp. RIFCSPLOWO2_02_FULL_36_28]OHE01621.1 MAG: F0F1 ATP synthase subunit gamma [Sulfurimonas sp. RIFCSPLOWO2_12_36_12]OHE03105.1 MAG: F0F1 ATP synthase subunit gamma [Sulfurimonas sp. RIFCSPLOWO2_12_FULL_36_74]
MANLKDIQRQIKSVSNTQKTTRAMKLVSTAKLRRAEELAKRSRLYAAKMNQVIAEIAGRIKCNKVGGIDNRCFIEIEDPKTVDIVFVTADKGLCGGFNIQTIKAVKKLLAEYKAKDVKVRLRGIGKKGIEFFKYNGVELFDSVANLSSKPDKERSDEFILSSIEDFKDGKIDALHLVYNGYKNMITQELHVNKILPVDASQFECDEVEKSMLEIEAQDEEKMLDSLVNRYVQYAMYYSLIDSVAAEHSARMQAMDAATNNAKDMVKSLKVQFNKARQAAITTELIEIISGVESMK